MEREMHVACINKSLQAIGTCIPGIIRVWNHIVHANIVLVFHRDITQAVTFIFHFSKKKKAKQIR